MRFLTTFALMISSFAACAVDDLTDDEVHIGGNDSDESGDGARTLRCISDAQCASLEMVCDLRIHSCVAPDQPTLVSPRASSQSDVATDEMQHALEHSSCTTDADCFNGACDEDVGVCRYYPF